jgi:hypothetical protein
MAENEQSEGSSHWVIGLLKTETRNWKLEVRKSAASAQAAFPSFDFPVSSFGLRSPDHRISRSIVSVRYRQG